MDLSNPLRPDIDVGTSDLPDYHEVVAELREHGPVVPIVLYGKPAWMIVDYAELSAALPDNVHFNPNAGYGAMAGDILLGALVSFSGDQHRAYRMHFDRFFSPVQIRAYTDTVIAPIAQGLLDDLPSGDDVDFYGGFIKRYPFRIISALLDLPLTDEHRILDWAVRIFNFAYDFEDAMVARREFHDYVVPLIQARRAAPGADFISHALQAEYQGEKLDDEQMLPFLTHIYPAGVDTTYLTLISLLAHVLKSPELIAQAKSSDERRRALADECLRWESSVAGIPRLCTADIELGGARIRKDDWVLMAFSAANNDPKAFPDPRRFDPDRKGPPALTFGYGNHFCLGRLLARRELEVALKVIFERLPDLSLAPGQDLQPRGGILRAPRQLRVRTGRDALQPDARRLSPSRGGEKSPGREIEPASGAASH